MDIGHSTGGAASRVILQDHLGIASLQSKTSRSWSPGWTEQSFPALLSRMCLRSAQNSFFRSSAAGCLLPIELQHLQLAQQEKLPHDTAMNY